MDGDVVGFEELGEVGDGGGFAHAGQAVDGDEESGRVSEEGRGRFIGGAIRGGLASHDVQQFGECKRRAVGRCRQVGEEPGTYDRLVRRSMRYQIVRKSFG